MRYRANWGKAVVLNLMHNLQAERFYKARMINGMMATADSPIKTFPLRAGSKNHPPTCTTAVY